MKKDTVLSHTSELDTGVLSWLSSAEQSLAALSVHFLSKIIILHMLRRKREEHQVNADIQKTFDTLQKLYELFKGLVHPV